MTSGASTPTLARAYERIVDVDWNAEIIPGRLFLEHVYDGALADLGKKVNAEVSVTLWYTGDALRLRQAPSREARTAGG